MESRAVCLQHVKVLYTPGKIKKRKRKKKILTVFPPSGTFIYLFLLKRMTNQNKMPGLPYPLFSGRLKHKTSVM